jgi:peptidyl-prolyl cis-trans isomerase C
MGACERREVGRTLDDPGPVVARLNGKPLYKRDFDSYLPEGYQRALTMEERRLYLDRWISTELLYDAARGSGMRVTPDIEAKMEQLKKDLVADKLVQRVIQERAIVTDQEVRDYYNARIDEYTKEYRVSHILLSSLDDAVAVQEELEKRPFSWVARRHSLDKHTGPGGDLGYLSKGNMIPEFEEVVFDMKVDEVSDVIESDFGYHLIKLTAVREARNKLDYEDAAEDISRILLLEKRTAVYDSLIAALMDRADIQIVDPNLKMMIAEPEEIDLPVDAEPAPDTLGATVRR